ncbi:MAG TPA: AMP-binding protein [Terriglobia bacterium]|nr:AMP-binding protein [Terriglobia bacterium]
MLSGIRQVFERTVVGNSPASLVKWGKAMPRPVIRRIQTDAFRKAVRYAARRQKFFAAKLHERGIDPLKVRKPEDLGDIFTTPEDLISRPAEDFLCRDPQAVFETTGTSGPPKRIYFSYDELDRSARYEAAALAENGVTTGDRVVCTFDAGYWVSSWVTYLACKHLGVLCSAVGKPQPRDVYGRMATYRYNVIAADPTWLVSFTEIAEREGVFPVKLILAAGDRMTDVYRNYVQSVWKTPVVLGYGSTEAGGGLGMECRQSKGYHVDEFNFLFEILEPDSEGYGELVFTTLSRRIEPLIRYRARDITRLDTNPCVCGATLGRLDMIRGRRDEMVVMGAGNMHPAIFERILHDVDGISDLWQVAVRQEGLRDILEFRLELTNGIDSKRVEESVSRNIEARYPDIWANHLCDMYHLAFKFLPAGSLAPSRKPRRLVDERNAQ